MNNVSNYKKIAILLTLCVLGLFAVSYLVYKELLIKNESNANLLQRILTESSREVYATSIQKQLEKLDPDIKKVESSIVPASDVVSFIEELENTARNNGLEIKNDSISEEADSKLSSTTVVFLKIKSITTGTWAGTYKFLSELESLPHKVRISSFSITNSTFQSDASLPVTKKNWDATFEIKVLKFK